MISQNEKQISFENKLFRSGNSFVVVIPKHFIKAGVIDVEKDYEFMIKEKKEVQDNGI